MIHLKGINASRGPIHKYDCVWRSSAYLKNPLRLFTFKSLYYTKLFSILSTLEFCILKEQVLKTQSPYTNYFSKPTKKV